MSKVKKKTKGAQKKTKISDKKKKAYWATRHNLLLLLLMLAPNWTPKNTQRYALHASEGPCVQLSQVGVSITTHTHTHSETHTNRGRHTDRKHKNTESIWKLV